MSQTIRLSYQTLASNPDFQLSYPWIRVTEQEKKDYSWHNQICQDTLVLLKQYREAYLFNEEQITVIKAMCEVKHFEIKILRGDGYFIITRRRVQ